MWRYQGSKTLAYYLRRRDCIAALAEDLGVEREAVVATVFKQVLEGVSVSFLRCSDHKGEDSPTTLACITQFRSETCSRSCQLQLSFQQRYFVPCNFATTHAPLGIDKAALCSQHLMQPIPTQALHSAGLVHRDVKPMNIIFDEDDRRFKLIDLGACADLRSGTNYVPDESILDPTYCPPEQVNLNLSTA